MLDLTQDYFELFELPRTYRIDGEILGQRFRNLQRALHPDRFAHAADQERRLSMQGATLVNEAYQTLCNPTARANYLLTLHGIDIEQQKPPLSSDFLVEQMKLREQLATVRDHGEPLAELDRLAKELRQRLAEYQRQLTDLLDGVTAESLEQAAGLVQEMQFIDKISQDLLLTEEQLDYEQ